MISGVFIELPVIFNNSFYYQSEDGMSNNAEFAKRIIKMRIKYVLEKSQGQIIDDKKLRSVAAKLKQGGSQTLASKEIEKLALTGIEKAKPLLKDVMTTLIDEYMHTIKEITDEAIVEILNSEIQKIVAEET
jgi:hypothetical protein